MLATVASWSTISVLTWLTALAASSTETTVACPSAVRSPKIGTNGHPEDTSRVRSGVGRSLLVGHLPMMSPLLDELGSATDGRTRTGSGTSKWMETAVGPLAARLALATPFKWGRVRIPGASGGFQPVDHVLRRRGLLAIERTMHQDALDGLGHVQPRPAQRRVQAHHAVVEQPHHETGGVVAGQVVHDQQQAQRWQLIRQRGLDGQAGLPELPGSTMIGFGQRGG